MALRLYVIICIACMVKCEACPTNCSCDSIDLSVNCTKRNLLNIPEGIPNQTLELNLIKNSITEIPTGSFATMENLTHLYLSNNLIRFINNYTFAGLGKLQTLSLDYNKPLYIAVNTFRELIELQVLTLIAVGLEDFTGLFVDLNNLVALYLSNNLIRFINNYTFAGLGKLQTLSLDYNKPLYIAVNTFRELKELQVLTLIAVGLEDFTGLFVDLNNLVALKLMRNGAKYLQNGVFSGLFSLKYLYVQKNAIAFVEDRVFEDLKNLILLRIEFNSIKKIDSKILHDLRGLQEIQIRKNPLTCDCDAVNLKDFLLSRREESGIECAEFGGEDLLNVEDFSMCAKRGLFCSAENVQIIVGELIALITNAQTPVKCGINCGNELQCNGFVLREDNLCELWGISHKNIAYNISMGHRMFVLC